MPSLRALATKRLVLPYVCRRGRLDRAAYLAELEAFDALSAAERTARQFARLRRLLAHAGAHSPHYRAAFAAAGVEPADVRGPADLAAIPLLTKADLRGRPTSDFLCGGARGSRAAETAGTSGQAVTVRSDWNAYARTLIRRNRAYSSLGIEVGDREARFWGRAPRRSRDVLLGMLANRRVFTFQESSPGLVAREAAELVRFAPDYAYGYSSLLLRAADHFEAADLAAPRLKAVICTAETLLPSQATRIGTTFGCPVTMEYGCTETDIIAFGCAQGNYHVLEHHAMLESVVCEEGGEPEAVVTDLDNRLMPLIRYRLGDLVRLLDGPCPCGQDGQVLEAVVGRTLDQTLRYPDGRTLHAVVFAHVFESLCAQGEPIQRFKAYQTAHDELEIRIEGPAPGQEAAVGEAVRRALTRRLGDDFRIRISCGAIAVRKGEKFTYFVPLRGGA